MKLRQAFKIVLNCAAEFKKFSGDPIKFFDTGSRYRKGTYRNAAVRVNRVLLRNKGNQNAND